jgi:hypothetical protein
MEFVRGVKAAQFDALAQAGVDRDLVARRFLRAMIKQVLVEGFFHGDPHPGNIVIDPETGVLTFLDLGLMGELDSNRPAALGLMGAPSARPRWTRHVSWVSVSGLTGERGRLPVMSGASSTSLKYGSGDFSPMMMACSGSSGPNGPR